MERSIEEVKHDMEFEAMSVIREITTYADDSNIERDFVIGCFVDSLQKHKGDTDIKRAIEDFIDKEIYKI